MATSSNNANIVDLFFTVESEDSANISSDVSKTDAKLSTKSGTPDVRKSRYNLSPTSNARNDKKVELQERAEIETDGDFNWTNFSSSFINSENECEMESIPNQSHVPFTNTSVSRSLSPVESCMIRDKGRTSEIKVEDTSKRGTKWFDPWVLTEEDYRKFYIWGVRKTDNISPGVNNDNKNITRTPSRKMKRSALERHSTRYRYLSPLAFISKLFRSGGSGESSIDDIESLIHMLGVPSSLPCMQCYEQGYSRSVSRDGISNGAREGRCERCGAKLMSVQAMVKCIKEFNRFVETKDLVAHDVFPDGNCQFGAVLDQLRSHGDFRLSLDEIRQAAVDYLRQNPTANDGTPYSQFVATESWEEYLERMSMDGEWGDHMTLSAMANLLQMKIVVYGGQSGTNVTEIVPRKKKECSGNDCLYIGHISEMHYLSLRRKDCFLSLSMKKSEYVTGKDAPFPMMHLDFVLDLILETDRITYIEKSILEDFDMPQSLNVEMVGPLICGLMQSPGEKQNSSVFDTLLAKKSNRNKGLSFIYYPGDTKVCITSGKATKVDLIPDGTISDIFRLVPERYKLWKGQTTGSANIQYLKWLTPESKCKFPNLIGFMMEWPNYATEWVSRDRPNPFLSPEMIQSIVRLGCHVVPAKPDSGFEDIMTDYIPDNLVEFQTWWNISFATAEKYVCRALTKRQRQCFIVYKYLASLGIQESDRLPAVIVSHVFFYAIENIPTENWTYFPYQCILVVLKRLRDDLQEKRLPHYFMTQKNLLQYVPDDIRSNVLDSLNHIISNPVGALYQAFECLGVMSSATNINIFVDEAFRDMYNFALHGDCKRSFWKALVPTCSQVMKDILDSDEYEIAFGLLQSLNSRQAEILKESQSTCEIATLLTESLFMFDRWAFYYFMDISTGTALTFKLCNDIPSIQIAEVFGPELQEILTEALLPVEAAIDSGNVLYALRMVSVLKSINHPEATVSSLKFYLKRYIEYAGEALVLPLSDQEANIAILQGRTAFRKLKGTQTFSKDMLTSSSLMYCLHDLHVTLFNTCQALKRDEEYVEFIPHFKAVVETLGAPPCRRNLVAILKNFGGETDASQQQPVTAILRLCGFSAIENDEASF